MPPKLDTEKRPPGRPRKYPITKPIKVNGIVDSPTNADYIVEFIYFDAVLIKKLFNIYQSASSSNICIIFTPVDIIIKAKDHLKQNKIKVHIDCRKVNRYYYDKNYLKNDKLRIWIEQNDIQRILSIIDATCSSFSIILEKSSYRKNINTVITTQIKNVSTRETISTIKLVTLKESEEQEEFFIENNAEYNLEFSIDSKELKKDISYISGFKNSLYLDIEKHREEPLTFRFNDNKIRFLDESQMNLKFNCKEDIFSVSVKLSYIKQFTMNIISDKVRIYTANNEDIKFEMIANKDIYVNIWSKKYTP